MLFKFNEFLMAISFALDLVEMDILGVTSNHGKRAAFIALNIAHKLGLSHEELHDLGTLTLLHDNGASERGLHEIIKAETSINISRLENASEHCIIGEANVAAYPFLTEVKNVLKYHHERYDGTGFFRIKGEEIPLMSQIIHISDKLEISFNLNASTTELKNKIHRYITREENREFSPKVVAALLSVLEESEFWVNIKDEFLDKALKEKMPERNEELSFDEIHNITKLFSKIIDSKSKYTHRHSSDLSEKAAIMADYYEFQREEKLKLIIAADLHDIGKLAVPNRILDNPSKLTKEEFDVVKKHTYYTRLSLREISGFEQITEWAANHHEKLNGTGYPYMKKAEELDFNSRLMGCLDIYEALTEDRPYRRSLSHETAIGIMDQMHKEKLIDESIVNDINTVFGRLTLQKP